MKPHCAGSARRRRKTVLLLWLVAFALPFLFPLGSSAADVDISFEGITIRGGGVSAKSSFLPGEEIQVDVRLRVLKWTGNPVAVRLRISGDGWHEPPLSETLFRAGLHTITYGGPGQRLFAASAAGQGKVSLLVDALSGQDTVSLLGRRHAYLDVRCPEGRPDEPTPRLEVGAPPSDMAVTADGRYLYVTSEEQRTITVLDVEAKAVVTEIEDPEVLGRPAGVAAVPDQPVMLVADSALQAIHVIVIDAETHVLQETIPLNPTGDLGVTSPGDVAVNSVRNEAYVTDARAPRIFIVDLASFEVGSASLLGPSAGLLPLQVMLDPDNSRLVYVLCQGFNEVIKVDVVSGTVVDFVRLRNALDPISLWPAWSMVLNPWTEEVYVVLNPAPEAETPLFQSKIIRLPKNWLGGPGRRDFLVGSSVWELVVREGGRFVYAIDSLRGEILVMDMNTETDLARCAIPVEAGGRFLRADPARNRLFVGGGVAGFVDIVDIVE